MPSLNPYVMQSGMECVVAENISTIHFVIVGKEIGGVGMCLSVKGRSENIFKL